MAGSRLSRKGFITFSSVVGGMTTCADPLNAMRAVRAPVLAAIRSRILNLARSSRLGCRSLARIESDTSSATTSGTVSENHGLCASLKLGPAIAIAQNNIASAMPSTGSTSCRDDRFTVNAVTRWCANSVRSEPVCWFGCRTSHHITTRGIMVTSHSGRMK